VRVNGRDAAWTRDGAELTVTPQRGLRRGLPFLVRVEYDGVPEPVGEPQLGQSGFLHTDDGAVVIGEPDVAATWFPVNDHPLDKAPYTFRITVPEGLEAIANGELISTRTRDGRSTWVWNAREPMASYLATATIGEFDVNAYEADGIRYWDAIDPDLLTRVAPRTGERFLLSQAADSSYKRLARTISVPAEGATLSFQVTRDTEPGWDYLFVEARTAGTDDWTTLPDRNGHTSQDLGFCPYLLNVHPFLAHYQTSSGDEVVTCEPTGTTGEWWAATGASDGYEEWVVDLSAYAGQDVEVSISYVSDDLIQNAGVFLDDVVVSTGAGSTSFEEDGDPLDGWTVPGPPADSPGNDNDWVTGTSADAPPPLGEIVRGSFARQPEIIAFLEERFGEYPFSAAGGIVDDSEDVGFALENQTRPIYGTVFFSSPESGDSVVVHELAHQWFGDSVSVAAWQHIWLNEGFASYAEWLWSEHEGLATAQEIFDANYTQNPPEFWELTIGDPGPERLFSGEVYVRGAMTLHQLRVTVGDEDFFTILRRWADRKEDANGTIAEFQRLAERISGQDLDDFFTAWLFTSARPELDGGAPTTLSAPEDVTAPAGALVRLRALRR
jgi:hypothetical protein